MTSGIQDPYYIQLINFLAGTCYSINSIDLNLTTNLDHTGRAEMEMSGRRFTQGCFRTIPGGK